MYIGFFKAAIAVLSASGMASSSLALVLRFLTADAFGTALSSASASASSSGSALRFEGAAFAEAFLLAGGVAAAATAVPLVSRFVGCVSL